MRLISRWLWTLIVLSSCIGCLLLLASQSSGKPIELMHSQQPLHQSQQQQQQQQLVTKHERKQSEVTRTPLRATEVQPASTLVIPPAQPAGFDDINATQQPSIRQRCWASGFSPASGKPIDHTPEDFVINESRLCSGRPLLLALVPSRFDARNRRDLIRSTWASINNVNGHRIVVAFFVGTTKTASQQAELLEESEETADIVQVPCGPDGEPIVSSCKALYSLRWARSHCSGAQFLLKVDDHAFVNVFHLVALATGRLAGVNNTFYCRTAANEHRITQNNYQWYVSEAEWPEDMYPRHCKGLAYLMSGDLPPRLLSCAAWRNYLRLEDIFVTGVLGRALGVRLMHWFSGWDFDWLHPRHAGPPVSTSIVLATPEGAPLPSLHRRVWKAALRHCAASSVGPS